MNKTVAICILIVSFGIICIIVISHPSWISDNNAFLRSFVGAELLNVLGVILAITLASSAQLHLEFNKIEERAHKKFLYKARHSVKSSAYLLIVFFALAVIIICLKPIVSDGERWIAVFNGACLFLLLWDIIVLIDLTQAAFAIPPHIRTDDGE